MNKPLSPPAATAPAQTPTQAPTQPPAGAGNIAQPPLKADGQIDWVRLFIGFGAMALGQFMAMLDIQIVASSLPQIQAGTGASADEIGWVQTAYLIPEVVMIPLSGYLSRLWGTQKLFLLSCAGFTIMSVLTGLSSSIEQMIITRALQGFIGGAMIPTVFAIAFTAFPPEKRLTAGTIMGLIVSLAPMIGPTLGGHLTDLLSWRWLFFINVIPGIAVLTLVWRYANFDRGDPSLAQGFDWFGLVTMAVFLMSLQYVIEEGASKSWLADDRILWLTVLAGLTGAAFIWRQLTYAKPIVELRALADRNFAVGMLINFSNGAILFGGSFLLPLFLGRIQGLTPAQVGTTMLVSGVVTFMMAPIASRVVRMFDPRIAMVFGLSVTAFGVWSGHGVTKDWGYWNFAWLQSVRSFGVMIAMIGGQMNAMSTLPPQLAKSASGILNLARNTGGAVGLALLSTNLTQQTASHMMDLSAAVSLSSTRAQAMLAGLTQRMAAMGVADPAGAGRKAFDGLIAQQAQVLAFGDGFALMTVTCLVAAVVSLLARPGPGMTVARPPQDSH
ncbi:MAG: DHA2 family efflux MFS transporter permease subunit [Caulobacteraceae bacterium]|nr:DHA2 family efflux MFS transporter permease subunit [Caulobacteraceae bacterium]